MDEYEDERAYYPTSYGMSNDHFHLVGNGRLVAFAYNHGEVVIYSGERGATWLNERDPKKNRFAGGYGFLKDGDTLISMRYPDRPEGCDYERRFGIGYFQKTLTCKDISITQMIAAPFGEETLLISEAIIDNLSDKPKDVTWYEYWDVNPHFFGAMIEFAGEEGESTGEGEGLAQTTPLLSKAIKMIPGEFTLSRFVRNFLHSWRAGMAKDFQVTTRHENGSLSLTASVQATEPIINPEDRAEIDYYPPVFFLSRYYPASSEEMNFETSRKISFDAKGTFTGRTDNGLVSGIPLKKSSACFISRRDLHLEPNEKNSSIYGVGYGPSNQLNDIISSGFKQLDQKMWIGKLPAVNLNPNWLNQEMIWHAYYLRAIATYDEYFQNRIMSQGCTYQYLTGMNIAARDPLQHMLPVVYLEPALAKDVLRYTLREMDHKGFIPYGIKGVGVRTAGGNPFPSDTELYLMLSLTEYVTATRDFAFLDEVLPYYPKEDGDTGTVMEHMQRAWRHLVDRVGTGEHGLIKLRNSDWNDSFLAAEKYKDPDLDLSRVEAEAESVLNTAMATYILPRFAGVVQAYGDKEWADLIGVEAHKFRENMRAQWNGEWFNRAILPGGHVVGGENDRMYLSPQPWAILGDVLDTPEEIVLDENLYHQLSSPSPIGAIMFPRHEKMKGMAEVPGTGTSGGVWYSLRLPLIMSYARIRPGYAWDEFIKMTNHTHAEVYPDTWIGQWSGPDSYNAHYAERPGQTWDTFPLSGAMMDFPVTNGHAHACIWFGLIKLMGIHPGPEGFTIDPRMPEGPFSVKTELIGLERGEGMMRGSITPLGAGPITWRVRVSGKPAAVKVNGKSVKWKMDGDFVVFKAETEAGKSAAWTIE
jgi:hypothetical protein